MRRLAAIAILAALADAGVASARPLRIMSMNQCTDQIVLQLLPPEQITSVSWLARDPSGSTMVEAARRVGVNYGKAEEVIRDKPDLVIASTFTTPATRALLRRMHYPLLEIGPIDSFDDIRKTTRQIAIAVGRQARGEDLLSHMEAALRTLASHPASPIRVVAWDGAGFSARKGSMFDAILTAAGAVNVAPEAGHSSAGAPSVETLLAAAPALLVRGEPGFEQPGRQTDLAFHPVIRRVWMGRNLVVPQSFYICGTPYSADAAVRLRDQLVALAPIAKQPLSYQRSQP